MYSLQINCVFFGITLKVLWDNQRKTKGESVNPNAETVKYVLSFVNNYVFPHFHVRDLMKAVIVLLPLLGLTWIIGILAVNNDTQVFAWIFAVLNSLQVIKLYLHTV